VVKYEHMFVKSGVKYDTRMCIHVCVYNPLKVCGYQNHCLLNEGIIV